MNQHIEIPHNCRNVVIHFSSFRHFLGVCRILHTCIHSRYFFPTYIWMCCVQKQHTHTHTRTAIERGCTLIEVFKSNGKRLSLSMASAHTIYAKLTYTWIIWNSHAIVYTPFAMVAATMECPHLFYVCMCRVVYVHCACVCANSKPISQQTCIPTNSSFFAQDWIKVA